MTPKEIREKMAALYARLDEMRKKPDSEGRAFTAEEQANWDKINADYNALEASLQRAVQLEEIEGRLKAPVTPPGGGSKPGLEDRQVQGLNDTDDELTDEDFGVDEARSVDPRAVALAMQGWMRRVAGYDVEERHVKAARMAGVQLGKPYFDIKVNKRALSSVDLTQGASTIAPGFSGQFEKALLAFGGMREVAQVLRTDTGAAMGWPTANDTGNKGRIVGENVAQADRDVVTGSQTWGAYKYTSDMIKVPTELIEDSAFDLISEVGAMCGERIARAQNEHFTTGTGASRPSGVVQAAALGRTAASTSAFTADEILDLIHSVDQAYRANARLMFHDLTLAAIRKLKDGQNRYLFAAATDGAPALIWDRPYTVNQDMPSAFTTGQRLIAFGDFSKYKIRDVRTLRLTRLNERFADADQVGFVAFFRSDGNLLNAGVPPVRYLALA